MENESNKFSNSEIIHTLLDTLALRLVVEYDENLKIEFKENFEKLIEQSLKDNYFWQYCPFDVYKSNFKKRKDIFLKKYQDADVFDFLRYESKKLVENREENDDDFNGFVYEIKQMTKPLFFQINSLIDETIARKIYYSTCKKMDFIEAILDPDTKIPPDSRKLKIIIDANDLPESETKQDSAPGTNLHHQIFNEGGYDLFLYLLQNFTRDDKTLKTKFSNLFHYLKYEQIIVCSQLQYISFIEEEYKIKLSKILPSNYKYSDQIQPTLGRLRNDFQQSLKAKPEMNSF